MGGFLLHLRSNPADQTRLQQDRALKIFERKGLSLDRQIERDGFVAYRFRKHGKELDHILEFPNGDFVLWTGTMLYRNTSGKAALSGIYREFTEGRLPGPLNGNFCVLVYKQKELWLITDYARYYPVYADSSGTVFSNSLLAVAKTTSAAVSRQEFFEYLLHGFFVDDETLLRDVRMLDSRFVHRLTPTAKRIEQQPAFRAIPPNSSFDQLTKTVAADLLTYFEALGNAFGDRIGTALSGGYDSRLMLALIRRTQRVPVVYVYGGDNAEDVTVAKAIAAGEGFPLEHVDKSKFTKSTPGDVASSVEKELYFFDGIKPLGLFDDGTDLATRFHRAGKSTLQLNGAGGEIYREIWNVGDRRINLKTFLRMRFDRGSYTFCRSSFSESDYFSTFTDKIKRRLGIDRDWISRREAEMLFPFLRNWFGAPNNAANNQISYSILPFMEPEFVLPSFDIPIQFKYCGRFEGSLIKEIDPALARYNSAYGINFFDPIPFSYRSRHAAERHIPLWVRLVIRRLRAKRTAANWPYYLGDDYVREVLDTRNMRVSEFVDVKKIEDPELLSRALSAELLLSAVSSGSE
jgi:hypothetical protein